MAGSRMHALVSSEDTCAAESANPLPSQQLPFAPNKINPTGHAALSREYYENDQKLILLLEMLSEKHSNEQNGMCFHGTSVNNIPKISRPFHSEGSTTTSRCGARH